MKQFLTRTKQKQNALKSKWLKTSSQMLPIFTKNNFSDKHQTEVSLKQVTMGTQMGFFSKRFSS